MLEALLDKLIYPIETKFVEIKTHGPVEVRADTARLGAATIIVPDESNREKV